MDSGKSEMASSFVSFRCDVRKSFNFPESAEPLHAYETVERSRVLLH